MVDADHRFSSAGALVSRSTPTIDYLDGAVQFFFSIPCLRLFISKSVPEYPTLPFTQRGLIVPNARIIE